MFVSQARTDEALASVIDWALRRWWQWRPRFERANRTEVELRHRVGLKGRKKSRNESGWPHPHARNKKFRECE